MVESTGLGEEPRELPSEMRVILVFRQVLGQPNLEPCANIWHAGGTSFAAMQICAELQIPIDAIYSHPTARSLSRHLLGDDSSCPLVLTTWSRKILAFLSDCCHVLAIAVKRILLLVRVACNRRASWA